MSVQAKATDVKTMRLGAQNRAMPFIKMHGLRNDFLIIDGVADAALAERDDWREQGPKMCDRRTGIGADGLLIIARSRNGGRNDFVMRVINADGSEPEMCGNGLRCAARLLVERNYASAGSPMQIETAGIVRSASTRIEKSRWHVTVDMGAPGIGASAVNAQVRNLKNHGTHDFDLALATETINVVLVSTGNPHAVMFTKKTIDALADGDFARLGHAVEHHAAFPAGINFQLVHVRNRSEVELGTWERGCGITQACGSGACASTVASALLGHTDRNVTVHMRGGDLHIEWRADNHLHMSGPAEHVFEGTWPMQ